MKIMCFVRILLGVAMLPVLAGCGAGNSVDFSSWANRYNNNVSDVRNQQLLLNILRAGDNMPLTFTAVQMVRGNAQAASSVGLGGSQSSTTTIQGGVSTITELNNTVLPSVSFAVTDGFGFDVVVLDSAEFYQGLRTPVSLDTLHYYHIHGLPEELLLNLLIAGITLTVDGTTTTHINDPGTTGHAGFVEVMDRFLRLGVTTEIVNRRILLGTIVAANVTDPAALTQFRDAAKSGMTLEPVDGGYRMVQNIKIARFCLMSLDNLKPTLPAASLCATSPRRNANTAAPETHGSLTIQTRSTLDVFSYLGKIVRSEIRTGQPPVALRTAKAQGYGQAGISQHLFRVVQGPSRGDNLAAIGYRGKTYSIPNDEQGHSATVMALTLELFSLSKSVDSVARTGTVIQSR